MRKLLPIALIFIFISSCAILQKTEVAEETLFTINNDPTIADEFLYVYEKNNFNNDSLYTQSDVDAYIDLFINFKLKVEAAKSEGMDTAKSFLDEYEGYKDQLIKPFLIETKEQEKLVTEAYERLNYEVDASHILVVVAADALAEDTTKAYQKISEVYEKAKGGQSFADLAIQYSEDPSAKTNKGRLGYFTAFQMVFAFEDAAYKTPVDSVSPILRSQFGYHIIKVHDRRPSSGEVKVAHIMLRSNADNTPVQKKIAEIHDQLIDGADWDELCKKYSEDLRTKNNGGTLPFIGLRQINDPAFESVAFGLQTPGEISSPVQSAFGWHIIKLEEKKGLEPFDKIKADLEQRVSKDDRWKLSKKAEIAKLKTQNKYHENPEAKAQLVQLADSSLLSGTWDTPILESYLKEMFFSIDKTVYTTAILIEEVKKKQKRRSGIDPNQYMVELIDGFIEKTLLDSEEKQLLSNNREFSMLLNEYYEGILLFEIMNQNVWGKAVSDTLGLREFFQQHQQDYYWGKRADAVIISTEDQSVLTNIKKIIHDESIKLFEIVLEPESNIDVLKNTTLDSLTQLYRKYDHSSITIYSNEVTSNSDLFKNIILYFNELGLQEQVLLEPSMEGQDNKIVVVLNSKSKKSLEFLYNTESTLTLQVTERQFEKGDNPILDSLAWEKGIFEFSENAGYFLVIINEIHDPQPKALKDVRGVVISDYQNYLEKVWLAELKSKYAIVINYTTLDKIKKAYRKKLIAIG